MKKLAVAILGLFVLITGCIGLSESESIFTISSLSDEELIELYSQINEEIVNRKIEKTAKLLAGTYEIGKDIPAGDYMIVVDNTEQSYASFLVIRDPRVYKYDHNGVPAGQKAQFYLTFTDGEIVEVYAPFELTIKGRGITFE